jgi:hypothetical protein
VQADLEPEPTHLGHGGGECGLDGWLPAAEDDGVEQPAAALEECADLRPGDDRGYARVDQGAVVAVATAPRTALTEDNRGELAGVVDRRQRNEAADT